MSGCGRYPWKAEMVQEGRTSAGMIARRLTAEKWNSEVRAALLARRHPERILIRKRMLLGVICRS